MQTTKEGGRRKDNGQFSRRHETAEAHNEARADWDSTKSRQAKQARATEMAAARAQLTPQQQLEELDRRLGKGVGAVRERARLAAQIAK